MREFIIGNLLELLNKPLKGYDNHNGLIIHVLKQYKSNFAPSRFGIGDKQLPPELKEMLNEIHSRTNLYNDAAMHLSIDVALDGIDVCIDKWKNEDYSRCKVVREWDQVQQEKIYTEREYFKNNKKEFAFSKVSEWDEANNFDFKLYRYMNPLKT